MRLINFQEMQYWHSVPAAVLYDDEIGRLRLVSLLRRRGEFGPYKLIQVSGHVCVC